MTQRMRATPTTREGGAAGPSGLSTGPLLPTAGGIRGPWAGAVVLFVVAGALLAVCVSALTGLGTPPALLVAALSLANFVAVLWLMARRRAFVRPPAVESPGVLEGVALAHPLEAIVDAGPGAPVELGRKQANLEKFAALGRLSAGVVHEINNPLGGILTCLEAMRTLEQGSERYEEYWSLAKEGLERIGTVVRQLLSFARQPSGERSDVDTNQILRDVVALTNLNNRNNAVRVVHQPGEVPVVHGFPDLMNQLFLNLALNALQAMPAGGTLLIRTCVDDGDVVTTLEDTGPGVPEENLERIFEPFFTTKEVGVGTGLGLSVALGIVEAHGGQIHGENRVEGGARFIVRLPHAGRATSDRPDRPSEA